MSKLKELWPDLDSYSENSWALRIEALFIVLAERKSTLIQYGQGHLNCHIK